jgi:hypothetical protein
MVFFEVGWVGNSFQSGPENLDFLEGRLPLPKSTSLKKFVGESLTSSASKYRTHDTIKPCRFAWKLLNIFKLQISNVATPDSPHPSSTTLNMIFSVTYYS